MSPILAQADASLRAHRKVRRPAERFAARSRQRACTAPAACTRVHQPARYASRTLFFGFFKKLQICNRSFSLNIRLQICNFYEIAKCDMRAPSPSRQMIGVPYPECVRGVRRAGWLRQRRSRRRAAGCRGA
jgi:hypothetical protein